MSEWLNLALTLERDDHRILLKVLIDTDRNRMSIIVLSGDKTYIKTSVSNKNAKLYQGLIVQSKCMPLGTFIDNGTR